MRKRHSYDRLFEGNPLVLFCVLFTVSVTVSVIINAIFGATFVLRTEGIIISSVYLIAPILPLTVFHRLWKSSYIAERDYLLFINIPLHYLFSSVLTVLFTFLMGLFRLLPLTPAAYISALITFTGMYALVILGAIVIDLLQTAKANGNLKKIQASLRR